MLYMKIKTSTLMTIALLAFWAARGQVNLQTGSAQYAVPIYSYTDPLSRLTNGIGLQYSSQNGLKVNEVASPVGTGWQLTGVSFVVRLQRGLADDQLPKEGSWGDTTKYPPGYLYNAKNADDGCPNALAQYPIFKDKETYYTNHNSTDADREVDFFMYNLNGRTGEFVIAKDWNVRLFDNARISIVPMTATDCDECRTNINQFVITDENGIRYEFGTKENARMHTYRPFYLVANSQGIAPFMVNKATEIPLDQKPFVTQAWYADRVTDIKANRQLRFEYNYQLNDYTGQVSAQYLAPFNNIDNNNPMSDAPINYRKTIVTQNRVTVKKPELKKVVYPSGEILELQYGRDREDIANTKALTALMLMDSEGQRQQKIQLRQQYFVKNEVRDTAGAAAKWARLCLTGLQKFGRSDLDKEGPHSFEYYTGSNTTEDFVPPYFFHAQDPWGYYNGSYCGVPTDTFLNVMQSTGWKTLCLYNNEEINYMPPPGDRYAFTTNAKSGYAKNGLLKKITGPYGGQTLFEYGQNRVAYENSSFCVDSGATGGVHVSKVTQLKQNGLEDVATTYRYINTDASSSIWGVEPPHNKKRSTRVYVPQSQYVSATGACMYRYKYPGIRHEQHNNVASNALATIRRVRSVPLFAKNIVNMISENSPGLILRLGLYTMQYLNLIANSAYSFLQQAATTCFIDPSTYEDYMVHFNSPVNYGNGLPIQFKRVEVSTESLPGQLRMGKTVHTFTSSDDYPLLANSNNYPYMGGIRYYKWAYGLPKTVYQYDNKGRLLARDSIGYALTAAISTDPKTKSCQCEVQKSQSYRNDLWDNYASSDYATTHTPYLWVEYHNIAQGRMEKKQVFGTLFDTLGQAMATTTLFDHHPINHLPTVARSTDSKGTVTESKTYYIDDYDLSAPAHAVLQQMYAHGLRNLPITTETWQTKPGGSPELLAASVTEYGTAPNGDYRPVKTYALQTHTPVPIAQVGPFNPQQLVRNSGLIQPVAQTVYDAAGNAVQTTELRGQRTNSTVYDYANRYAVATVNNAAAHEVAYTSFEADGANSRWLLGYNFTATEACPTGNKCLMLAPTGLTTTVSINKPYVLSFWATTNAADIGVPGAVPAIAAPTINGWTYYEYRLPAGSPSPVLRNNSGSMCKIDELRLYPVGATMATATFIPGVGQSSACDANNRIVYTEYDGLGRVSKVKDAQGNVVKTMEYHLDN
jgi:hypothetical protein